MDKKYLIDANIFITAHRIMYPFDIAPGFWNQLIDKASGKIIIIEKVHDEILKGEDQLTDWYIQNKDKFTILGIPEQEVIEAYGLAYDYTIVTYEKYKPNIRNRIPIPNICHEFNIKYIDLLQFMRETGFRL